MAVTTTSGRISEFIGKLAADYPQFKFVAGSQEHWSPRNRTITYEADLSDESIKYGLLHELAHALLDHNTYKNDFELLKMESQAWHRAAEIGKKYRVKIDEDHIQNCLDTYRDWLHRRSQCPACGLHVLQQDATTYRCFNCGQAWHVSSGRFARSYRRRT